MTKKIKIILVLFFIGIGLGKIQAQTNTNFNRIDRYVRKTPESVTGNIKSLHNHLAAPAINQTEMVRAFYMWIITNIKYDDSVELMYDPNLLFYIGSNTCASPTCVLKKRLAVCEGFSQLFQYFCNQSGIECYSIGGYIMKNGNLQNRATHSWNAAKIDGNWYFFDLSWAHAILHHTGIKSKANEYFMASPEEFVLTHLPLIPMWQFLANPVPLPVFNSGEDRIVRHVNQSVKNFNFTDSIAQFKQLSNAQKRLKTADEIYRTNPGNTFNRGVEYYRYSKSILNIGGKIDARQYYHLIKARKKLNEAIQLFQNSSDISSQLMLLQSQDNLKLVNRLIHSVDSDIIYTK